MASLLIRSSLVILFLMAVGGKTQTMNQLFAIDATCNGINLDAYLNDARTMLASARTGVSNLQSTTFFTQSTTRHYMRNARNTFGTTYYSTASITGLNSADKATMATVDDNLHTIQNLLAGTVAGAVGVTLDPNNAYISCSDASYVATTNAQDIDPNQPAGTTIQEALSFYVAARNLTIAKYYHGLNAIPSAFVIPGNAFTNANGVRRRVVRPYATSPGPICQAGVVALTQPQDTFTGSQSGQATNEPLIQIILCPPFFNNYRQTIAVTPAATDVIVNYKFAASAFIHETFHILGDNCESSLLIGENAEKLMQVAVNDERFYINGGTNQLYDPYGPTTIYALATSPNQFTGQYSTGAPPVINLPDAYRLFCDMCQFPGTKWYSLGVSTQGNKVKRGFLSYDFVS